MKVSKMKQLIFIILSYCISNHAFGHAISEEAKILAKCEGAYLYLAHLAQMGNNEGLAKNLLYRASRVTAAHLFLNEENGRVSEEALEQIKSERRKDRKLLDADPEIVITKGNECDKSVPAIISKTRSMNKIWDGKNFDEWQEMLFVGYRKSLGVR